MTDEELIARLHNLYTMLEEDGYYTKANTVAYTTDRIESLVKERDAERSKRKIAEGLAGLASADIDGHSTMIDLARNAVAKRIEAEARAERLEGALRWYSDDPSSQGDVARAALKGADHE